MASQVMGRARNVAEARRWHVRRTLFLMTPDLAGSPPTASIELRATTQKELQ